MMAQSESNSRSRNRIYAVLISPPPSDRPTPIPWKSWSRSRSDVSTRGPQTPRAHPVDHGSIPNPHMRIATTGCSEHAFDGNATDVAGFDDSGICPAGDSLASLMSGFESHGQGGPK